MSDCTFVCGCWLKSVALLPIPHYLRMEKLATTVEHCNRYAAVLEPFGAAGS